ncbi:MAG: Tat pathway signal protein, partial [Saprospiraceae bacterium]|nr:Tat pathway signal protein [Saprospiraceae bacterium]
MKYIYLLSLLLATQITNAQSNKAADPFLDSLSYHTFQFFWQLGNTDNAQIPDRWPTDNFSSIAATGFGLTSYVIGVEQKYVSRKAAAERVLRTLQFLQTLPKGNQMSGVAGYKGFFYHFLDQKTGLRFKTVELSTIDTGLLMAGILVCMTYFDADDATERAIRDLADQLYRAVEWDWAMNGKPTMSMGWFPDRGFLESSWRGYNEAMVLLVMAIGSPTHPIKAEAWRAWTETYQWRQHLGQEYVNFGPLFGHQYSHCYIDFRGIKDDYMRTKGIDYFENSRRATLANWKHCTLNPGG